MAQGSVKPANQRGRRTLIALSNNRGPLLQAPEHRQAKTRCEAERHFPGCTSRRPAS